MQIRFIKKYWMLTLVLPLLACQSTVDNEHQTDHTSDTSAPKFLPFSDQQNTGNWILNTLISDEFNGTQIDLDKWFVQGLDSQYYIWKGRAPSQFAPHNVLLKDGILRLRSQWEPDFEFADESYADGKVKSKYGEVDGKPVPVTTAAIVSRKRFLNGYMEVRSRAANASMTSAFWAIGYQSELDVYEQIGDPTLDGDIKADTFKATVHDWSPPAVRPTRVFGHKRKLPFDVADAFHIYGAEWGEDYLKLFIDGELVYSVTSKEVGEDWVLLNPMEIWLDSEIFAWLGYPNEQQLPAYFDVDYVRVWQKPETNLLPKAFYGFEGPILFEENPRPLKLVPESSKVNEYQKFWRIDDSVRSKVNIVSEKKHKGQKSLKIALTENSIKNKKVAQTPPNAIDLSEGDYIFSAYIWIDSDSTLEEINFSLEQPSMQLNSIKLSRIAKGKWHKVEKIFSKKERSSELDRLTIKATHLSSKKIQGAIYIDDIAIEKLP